jgi:hypothetical protein
MKKLNVICYIRAAGPNVIYQNISDTILSINKNINTKYKFYITTDTKLNKEKIEEIILNNSLTDKLIEIRVCDESWSKSFNTFFNNFKEKTEYILCSHDDLIVRTYDFFNITMNEISGHEDEIGWIGFTSDSYYRIHGNPVCQSAREIFCKDRGSWPCTFELHNMSPNNYDESKLDMPKRACKVPGIFSHFNLIKCSNLEKIGLCPDWGNYTLLIDEHWSLQTLIKGLWTIWIPNIYYDHPLRYNERTVQGLQNDGYVTQCFTDYWGINSSGLSDSQIENFCERFPNTNLSFFNKKNTYDYQYLKN